MASVLALNELGYINASVPVTVHTKGGDLVMELKEEGAYLVGPAEVVYVGEVELRSPVTVGLPKCIRAKLKYT
jgi:diaminopimelate epimerase